MRAVRVARYGPPSVLEVASVPLPTVGPKQVILKVAVVAVNPVDTYLRAGTNGYAPALPYTPGHDASGTVVEVGPGCIKGLKQGDRVYTLRTASGSYAEYLAADEVMVRRIPEKVSFAEAACVPAPFFTAYRALFKRLRIRGERGKAILIHGASGAVGIAACQMAQAEGLVVIGTAGSEGGLEVIRPFCDRTARHDTSGAVESEVERLCGGKGVPFILEMAGHVNLQRDLSMIAKGGSICVVGSRADTSVSPRLLMTKECNVTGVMLYHNDSDDWEEAGNYIEHGLQTGSLKAVVGTLFKGLESAPAAHEAVIDHGGKGATGKILIELLNEA